MKKLSLLVLTMVFVFTISLVEVYAATTITTNGTGQAGDVLIASGLLARQTAQLSFTTSANVYVAFAASAAASAEHYTVSAGHLSGDKEYALASSGGAMLYRAGTPATAAINAAPAIDTAGAVTTTGWTGM